ncbi:MAG: preprotein translocase subunit YajC [Candidatus Aminicenantales bacterium]
MSAATLFTLFLQAQPATQGRGSFVSVLIPFILVFLIFYLLIIMPSRKRQKKHREMVEQLKPGDKIITSGGIYGTVMGVQKDKIELKIAANVKVDISKNAVGAVLTARKEEKPRK